MAAIGGERYEYGPLAEANAEAALALSAEAGWNQTAADWRLMIGAGEAVGCFAAGGRLAGSALLVPYDRRLAWLAMVLVTAAERRRGIATRLVAERLARADGLGLILGLDATPAGREVYRRLAFRDVYGLQRLAADDPGFLPSPAAPAAIRPLEPADVDAVAALDAAAFGAGRARILAYLRTAWPERALVADAGGRVRGCTFVRRGRVAHHLGPLTSDHADVAVALAAGALAGLTGRVVVDVPDAQSAFLAWLTEYGFRPLRPFTRMLRGGATAPGDPALTFAVAGPEFG